ncbi:CLAVATA3/ESR (CLE)-related protein 46-like [Cannabis sativa]|uniref:CLAVATA3/ESR (CLE)-related protein 46-like n=1 Tax=Cannabis sativa TaxID=3483 RepID=UPI0029C9C94A|nr:CLAVATA3/ESR (CLE)-related protein 46-like [Cannabis sativa]
MSILQNKMKRKQILAYFLYALLLLVASFPHYLSAASDNVKLHGASTPAKNTLALRQMLVTWANSRKLVKGNGPKIPSGPNPIGNRHPPSIHS